QVAAMAGGDVAVGVVGGGGDRGRGGRGRRVWGGDDERGRGRRHDVQVGGVGERAVGAGHGVVGGQRRAAGVGRAAAGAGDREGGLGGASAAGVAVGVEALGGVGLGLAGRDRRVRGREDDRGQGTGGHCERGAGSELAAAALGGRDRD